jgi:hypothetical protein
MDRGLQRASSCAIALLVAIDAPVDLVDLRELGENGGVGWLFPERPSRSNCGSATR